MENKFKIGDKVRILRENNPYHNKIGVIIDFIKYIDDHFVAEIKQDGVASFCCEFKYLELVEEEKKMEKVKFLEVLSNKKYHSKDYLFELNGMYYWWTDSSNGVTGSIPLQFVSCSKEQYEDIDANYEGFPYTLAEVTVESDLLVIKKPESNYYLCYDEYDSGNTNYYVKGRTWAWSKVEDAKIFTSKEKKELEDNYPMHPGWYFKEVE